MTRHLKLLRKLAAKYSDLTGIDRDDLYGEACFALLNCLPHYDPKKSSKSTYIWTCVKNHLISYINRKSDEPTGLDYKELEDDISFYQIVENLSRDAAMIVQTILNHAEKYAVMDSNDAKVELFDDMSNEFEWGWKRTLHGIKDVKMALNC